MHLRRYSDNHEHFARHAKAWCVPDLCELRKKCDKLLEKRGVGDGHGFPRQHGSSTLGQTWRQVNYRDGRPQG